MTELVSWGEPKPAWASSDWSCSLWQFATHWYQLLFSVLLVAIVYHAFITLFLDYSGSYEDKSKRALPLTLSALLITTAVIVSPSAFYAKERVETPENSQYSHFSQFCDLQVPSLVVTDLTPEVKVEAAAAFRLTYELVLPYLLPLAFLIFPYVTLLIGLMKNVPAASHSEHSTKITVVVTLWLLTSFLMLHVASVLRNVFSVLSVWHR